MSFYIFPEDSDEQDSQHDFEEESEPTDHLHEEFVPSKIRRTRTALNDQTIKILQRCFKSKIPPKTIAQLLDISPDCVYRRKKQFDSCGKLTPLSATGPKTKITQDVCDEIAAIVESIPSPTIPDILSYLSPEVRICPESCRGLLLQLGYSFKQIVDVSHVFLFIPHFVIDFFDCFGLGSKSKEHTRDEG